MKATFILTLASLTVFVYILYSLLFKELLYVFNIFYKIEKIFTENLESE